MRKKATALLAPAALLALPLAGPAFAAEQDTTTYTAQLNQLNESGASGDVVIERTGDQVSVNLTASGLAETFNGNPYPHVQHIHVMGRGECPTPSADANGDGIVDTVEGQPAYGGIGTTLSTEGSTAASEGTNIKVAPAGGSIDYSRTFTLNDKSAQSLDDGTGVIVVHGLNPAGLSEEAANAKSNLVPELPLAATAPALCGALSSSQMGNMPSGSVDTGGGSTSGIENAWLFGAGGLALLAAGGTLVMRRRREGEQS